MLSQKDVALLGVEATIVLARDGPCICLMADFDVLIVCEGDVLWDKGVVERGKEDEDGGVEGRGERDRSLQAGDDESEGGAHGAQPQPPRDVADPLLFALSFATL